MASFIGTMVYWNLYPSLFCLALLCVPVIERNAVWPLPLFKRVREGLLTHGILAVKFVGNFNYCQFVALISFVVFAWVHKELQSTYESKQINNAASVGSTCEDDRKNLAVRMSLLKLERNWWIALFSVVCWIVVYVLNERTRELEKLQEKKKQLKSKGE